jgi:hypothetical protein
LKDPLNETQEWIEGKPAFSLMKSSLIDFSRLQVHSSPEHLTHFSKERIKGTDISRGIPKASLYDRSSKLVIFISSLLP